MRHRLSYGSSPGNARLTWIGVGLLSLLAFPVAHRSPIDYTLSDPWGNLLTAQAILEHGSVELDAYAESRALAELRLAWEHDGHSYYFFPLGTPLLALPAVGLANLLGEDMAELEANSALQRLLAAATVALSVPLIFALSRLYLPALHSFLVVFAFVFGSSTASTLGTALWSSNPTFLLNLLVLLLLVRDQRGLGRVRGSWLAVLLFFSYLCRPTALLFCLVVFVYVAFRRRPLLLEMGGTFMVLVGTLVLFSYREYGEHLPPYYQASRLGADSVPIALFGNLLSPSRGLLVLCPYLVLTLAGGIALRRRVGKDDFFRLALAWLLLHWVTISLYYNWWGAWSFGNRLFADALPAALLLTLGVGRAAFEVASRRAIQLATFAFAALAAAAVWIHTFQGLYSVYPFLWCQDGTYVRHLFDWRHPQFRASAASLAEHRREHLLPALPARSLDSPITPTSPDVLFESWSRPENDGSWRWTNGHEAAILFQLEEDPGLDPGTPLALEITAGTFRPQEARVRVNGALVGRLVSTVDWEPATYSFDFDARILERAEPRAREGRPVEIAFEMPGALSPASLDPGGHGDRRVLGLCLRRLTLRPRIQAPAPR